MVDKVKFCCFCGSTQHSLSQCPWKQGIHSEYKWKQQNHATIFSYLTNLKD